MLKIIYQCYHISVCEPLTTTTLTRIISAPSSWSSMLTAPPFYPLIAELLYHTAIYYICL